MAEGNNVPYGDGMWAEALKGLRADGTPTSPNQSTQEPAAQEQSGNNLPLTFGQEATKRIIQLPGAQPLQFGQEAAKAAQSLLKKQQTGQSPMPTPPTTTTTPAQGITTPASVAGTVPSTTPAPRPEYDSQIQETIQGMQDRTAMLYDQGNQLAMQEKQARDQAQRTQLLRTLSGTDFFARAQAQGKDPNMMSAQEITEFAATQGFYLSEEEQNRIRAGGMAALQNLALEKDDALARISFTEQQLEREYGRALDETEKMLLQQDIKMRQALAAFGGGGSAGSASFSGIVGFMNFQREGQTVKNNLLNDFGDARVELSFQANEVARVYTHNSNMINIQMSEMLHSAYLAVSQRVDELIQQGVDNEVDLYRAMHANLKDYVTTYNNITLEGTKMIEEQNRFLMNYDLAFRQEMRENDRHLSDTYGVVFSNGEQVRTPDGQPVPTYEHIQFMNDYDRTKTLETGYLFQDGQFARDDKGRLIPSFPREQFERQEDRQDREFATTMEQRSYEFEETMRQQEREFLEDVRQFGVNEALRRSDMALDVQKFNEDVRQFGMEYALRKGQFEQQQEQWEYTRVSDMVEQGVMDRGAMNQFLRPQDVISSGNYVGRESFNLGDRLMDVAGKIQSGINKSLGENCVQFVRSIIPDLPTGLWTLADKTRILLNSAGSTPSPEPGAVVVMETGQQWGHVAVVTSRDLQNRTITVSETNWNSGQYGTRTISMDDPSIKGYWMSSNIQQSDIEAVSPFTNDQIQAQQRSAFIQSAIDAGDIHGAMRATAGSSAPTQSERQMLTDARMTVQMLNDLDSLIDRTHTGPLAGRWAEGRSAFGLHDDASLIQAQVERLIPKLARGVFGEVGVLTDTDIARYRKTIPDLNSTQSVNQLLSMATRDLLARSVTNHMDTLMRSGVDVSLYTDLYDEFSRMGAVLDGGQRIGGKSGEESSAISMANSILNNIGGVGLRNRFDSLFK